ncbi:MAG: hypothetical protein KA198_07620 [Chitinophagaceae bacterium]|nr:hypothetical protein [Chitinophagaceae bacterium]
MKKYFLAILFLYSHVCFALTPEQDRLLSFVRLYSTVKYYYPDPLLHDFQWYTLAYKGYELAYSSSSDENFNKELQSLFSTFAPGVQISKEAFALSKLTPKDALAFPTMACWQHKGALNPIELAPYSIPSINYIYPFSIKDYHLFQYLIPTRINLNGKKVRISFWAKLEANTPAYKMVQIHPQTKSGNKYDTTSIEVNTKEWKKYEIIVDYPKDVTIDKLQIHLPNIGSALIDQIKVEKQDSNKWVHVDLNNTDFENYSDNDLLLGWEDGYSLGNISIKEAIDKKSGRLALRLASIDNKKLYENAPLNQPFELALTGGYKAYIPLTLKADAHKVYPFTDTETLNKLGEQISKGVDSSSSAKIQAITFGLEALGQWIQDYAYKDEAFEQTITSRFFQALDNIRKEENTKPWHTLFFDFMIWANDPHISFTQTKGDSRNLVKLPVQVKIGEHELIIQQYLLKDKRLQPGDILLSINQINLDSLFKEYEKAHLSRSIQNMVKRKYLNGFFDNQVSVQVKRGNETITETFTKEQNLVGPRTNLVDSAEVAELVETKEKYLDQINKKNAIYLDASDKNIASLFTKDLLRNEKNMDSLINVLNQHKQVIIDLRNLPNNFFFECLTQRINKINFNEKYDVQKNNFKPIAKFEFEKTNFSVLNNHKPSLNASLFILTSSECRGGIERLLFRIKNNQVATLIGEPTAGLAGAMSSIKIFKRLEFRYTAFKILDPTSSATSSFQGVGIAPNYLIYATPKAIAEGKDEVLEKVLSLL